MSTEFKLGDEIEMRADCEVTGVVVGVVDSNRVTVKWSVTELNGKPIARPSYTYKCTLVHRSSLSIDNPNRSFVVQNL